MSPSTHYRWATSGDTNAFFGLSLDNLADLTLAVSLLVTVFNYPLEFALSHFVPGTALGVIVGDAAAYVLHVLHGGLVGVDELG